MQVRLQISPPGTVTASETLLGHNLDGVAPTIQGLLSDRLENGHFAGPAQPQTGLAPGWQPLWNQLAGVHYSLVAGMSLSGHESQFIADATGSHAILQTGRHIVAGERLEVELWAKTRSRPTPIQVSLRSAALRQPPYASAPLQIDATWWQSYQVVLEVPCTDEAAVFCIELPVGGELWIDQVHLRPVGEGLLCRELLERMTTLRIPALRFPGSCLSTNYHWRLGTGPAHLRPVLPDPIFKWRLSYEFGTDEYLVLCQSQGIRPHLVVNIGSGTPDEASAWAEYVVAFYRQRGRVLPEIFFQMGNEQYGYWESSHMSGAMYVAALRAFVPPIRAVCPTARIIALGHATTEVPNQPPTPWRTEVLAHGRDLFDLLALNCYPGIWHDDDAGRMADVVCSVDSVIGALRQLRDESQMPVALTEWNYWLHAAHWDGKDFYEPGDTQHALFAARLLAALPALAPDLALANFYQLVNPMGVFRHRGARVESTALAEVFTLYRPAFPGQIAPVRCEPAMVTGLCLRNAAGTWLFLVNCDPSQTAEVMLPGPPAEIVSLVGANPRAAFGRAENRAGQLPPLSVTRYHFTQDLNYG